MKVLEEIFSHMLNKVGFSLLLSILGIFSLYGIVKTVKEIIAHKEGIFHYSFFVVLLNCMWDSVICILSLKLCI